MFISLFIDSLAFLLVFEINNSQQKSDRGMKISTFPAVKPFIKLTRGRIGREELRGVTFSERAGGKQVQGGGGGNIRHRGKGEGGYVSLGGEESCAGCQGRMILEQRWHLLG